jgi:hypothetical protein
MTGKGWMEQRNPDWGLQKGLCNETHGQEDQLSALGLVVNAIVLWNTYYMEEALSYIKGTGLEVIDEDVARLSPLLHKHINMLGRYHFELPPELQKGVMRQLRGEKGQWL